MPDGDDGRENLGQGVAEMGATFHFTIAAKVKEHPGSDGLQLPPKELISKRIMILEDNRTNLDILMNHARDLGIIAYEAGNRLQALNLIREGNQFDVGIIDMQLPNCDSMALAQEIRSASPHPFPLIAMTWIRPPRSGEDASLFAAQLTKPIKASQLYNALNAAINPRSAHQEMAFPRPRISFSPNNYLSASCWLKTI